MDPITGAGLALAVIPLVIAALQNYEYTLQPIVIFSSRYRKEVERLQDSLKVQKVDFMNECCFLLHSVTSNRGNVMVDDLRHVLWQEQNLEERLKARLNESYDACVSALSLINTLLTDVLKETKIFDIIDAKKHGRVDINWLKSLRRRSKMSFSKDRFDNKLRELESRIESLHKIRKHIEHMNQTNQVPDFASTAYLTNFRDVQVASSMLYDVFSSLWRCETQEEHIANICLAKEDDKDIHGPRVIRFDLAWTCPAQFRSSQTTSKSFDISTETLHSSQLKILKTSPAGDTRKTLKVALETAIQRTSPSITSAQSCSDLPETSNTDRAEPQDLCKIPDLCYHLGQQPSDASTAQCVGYLQKTETSKHLIYIHHNHIPKSSELETLEDALQRARSNSEGISLPEKLILAKFLARAVLQFHSTPWINSNWGSQDIVFLGIKGIAQDSPRKPFLRTNVKTPNDEKNPPAALPPIVNDPQQEHLRSAVHSQILWSLGIMLIELAYDSPLEDLQTSADHPGGPHLLYGTATRLADGLWRRLGPKYANAAKLCLNSGLGAFTQLDNLGTQARFFNEVVHILDACAEAISF